MNTIEIICLASSGLSAITNCLLLLRIFLSRKAFSAIVKKGKIATQDQLEASRQIYAEKMRQRANSR